MKTDGGTDGTGPGLTVDRPRPRDDGIGIGSGRGEKEEKWNGKKVEEDHLKGIDIHGPETIKTLLELSVGIPGDSVETEFEYPVTPRPRLFYGNHPPVTATKY